MRSLYVAILGVTLASPALGQDKDSVRQWIHEQKTEFPIEHYSIGTNCCDEADGKQRTVETLGNGLYRTYDDNGHPLEFGSNALGTKDDSPFFQWFVYIYGGKVLCARKPQTGG